MKKIALIQINNSFSDHQYLPYSVGLLQSHFENKIKTNDFEFLLPVYKRESVNQIVEKVISADIIAFSCYVWNVRISLEVAKKLKELNPKCFIIFGGPQVPDNAEAFMRSNPFIDIACHGEGEDVFRQIILREDSRDWTEMKSISFLENNKYVLMNRAERIKEIEILPSPYLSGTFSKLMETYQEKWLVLWETNRGCPFSCSFCDWGSAVGSKVGRFELDRIFREVDWMSQNKIEFVFCCDANFGMLPRDVEIAEYIAKVKKETGYPHALSVQNAKNATERTYQVQKILGGAGLSKGVTLSMQSLDPTTLKNIKRGNISSETYSELQKRFAKDQVETYSDIILGLPGETYETLKSGICKLIEDGQNNRIQFNNLSILPNAEMGSKEYQKEHGIVIVESKQVSMHCEVTLGEGDVTEYQELVVGTNSTPKEDWVKSRSFCWVVSFFYFNKILQIPIITLVDLYEISFKEIFEFIAEKKFTSLPILNSIVDKFIAKAINIQQGGEENCAAPEHLNLWWPVDELAMIELCKNNQLKEFYQECEDLLKQLLETNGVGYDVAVIRDCIKLNHQLIRMPFIKENKRVTLQFNIWEIYKQLLVQEPIILEQKEITYVIQSGKDTYSTWDEWCREVIWYGNKKGAYLHQCTPSYRTELTVLQPEALSLRAAPGHH